MLSIGIMALVIVLAILNIRHYTRTKHYLIKVPFTMPRGINLSGLVDAVRSHASSVPGLIPDQVERLYKTGISEEDIQYELRFWVTDPRQPDDARSRVIDIIGQFYPEGHDGHNGHHGNAA